MKYCCCADEKFVTESPQLLSISDIPCRPDVQGSRFRCDIISTASSHRLEVFREFGKSPFLYFFLPHILFQPGATVGLDGERYIEKILDLPTKPTEFVMRSRLVGVHKRGSGALVEIETEIIDAHGTLYYRYEVVCAYVLYLPS